MVTTPLGVGSVNSFSMVPVITLITPATGITGATVTINGKDFDSALTGNIVYFGGVRAKILSATAQQLVAQVPGGATYEPISVTVNGLTAYSNKQFDVTFANGTPLTPRSFLANIEYPAQDQYISDAYGVNGSYITDIDGDGKPDIVILKNITFSSNKGFCIFRNKSLNGKIDFAVPLQCGDFVQNATGVVVKDIDGDGKPDVAITNGGGGSSVVSIFRNTSTPGNISFAIKSDFLVGSNTGTPAIGDLDGDGKPDLVIPNGNGSSSISVLMNNSIVGSIKFSSMVNYETGSLPYSVAIGDLNGDGKADIAVANAGSTTVAVFKNTSSIGKISFDAKSDYEIGNSSYDLKICDLEGDGKPEIIVANSGSNTFSVLKNSGSNGAIGFATKVDYVTGNTPYGFSIGDLDGDGKPDIAVANNYNNSVSVFNNISSNGTIAFASKVDYSAGNQPRTVSIADLNADGRPEMVTANWRSYTAYVLENKVGESILTDICPPSASTSLSCSVTGAIYQWQMDIGNGFLNISDNNNYSGTNTATLNLNNISSSSYGYQYRCVVDGIENDVYKLKVVDTWIGGLSANWENPDNWSCGSVPDGNTDVVIKSGKLILSSNATVKSITMSQVVNFTVINGNTLTIKN